MAGNDTTYERLEALAPDSGAQPQLLPELSLDDIIFPEDMGALSEAQVAGYTVDIGKYFTSSSGQQRRFNALEQMLHESIGNFPTDKGFRSVVSIGDKQKISRALDANKLFLFDTTTRVLELDLSTMSSDLLYRTIASVRRKLHNANAWFVPVRDWPGYSRNLIFLPFDITSARAWKKELLSNPTLEFQMAMHELMHHMEFESGLTKTSDWEYTAYRERNTAFLDRVLVLLPTLVRPEAILMRDDEDPEDSVYSEEEHRQREIEALRSFLRFFVELKRWEAGEAPSYIQGIEDEAYQAWLPDHDQLADLLGIRIRSKDILEHYASGVCGEKLQWAARLVAWKLSFDDEEKKLRQQALRFTEMHRMSETEAKEHMEMVEERLKEKREAFEEEFKELYGPEAADIER